MSVALVARLVGWSFGGRRSDGMVVMAASVGANDPKAWPVRSPSLEEGGGIPRECAHVPCLLVVVMDWAGVNVTGGVCWLHAATVMLRTRSMPMHGLLDGM